MIEYGYCHCGCGRKTSLAKCNDISKGHVKGEPVKYIKHHRWRKGVRFLEDGHRRLDRTGYVSIYKPDHPKAHSGYIKEHVFVIEQAFGRLLTDSEVVHHLDENRSNNYIGNLVVFPSLKKHRAYHVRLRAFKASGHYDWRKCSICHMYDNPEKMSLSKSSRSVYHKSCAAIRTAKRKAEKKHEAASLGGE